MKSIDLNCDMGESFGVYKLGADDQVIKNISSANIACGFHAGDPQIMDFTVKLAKENGVAVGAHPGFDDLSGFGRRKIDVDLKELENDLIYQIGALQGFCKANGVKMVHVKAHGALNNMASVQKDLALTIARATKAVDPGLIFVVLPFSEMEKAGQEEGLTIARESFADRAYTSDGMLVSRKEKGAVIHDPGEVVERVLRMVTEGKVRTFSGEDLTINPDTICVHGDNPEAVALTSQIKAKLDQEGISIKPLSL